MAEQIIEAAGQKIKITNPGKVLFPDEDISKFDIINYYKRITPYILPHIKNRPLTLIRYPRGIIERGFFQKNTPEHFPAWIDCREMEKKGGDTTCYILAENEASLIFLANQSAIVLHPWLSKVDKPRFPDRIIFDLDPGDKNFTSVKKGAMIIKKKLTGMGFYPFVMTTGSKGLHVTVPVKAQYDYKKIKPFSRKIAEEIVNENSRLFTIEQRKNKREGKIFIDYLRNEYAQTAVAPYSLRAIKNAPVATPLDWSELKKIRDPQHFTIKNIFRRLSQKKDPWKDIETKAADMNIYYHNFKLYH